MARDSGTYTVGEVARVAHVSVRTLHHYDDAGLLEPSVRSEAGYRLYTPEDLERLQAVLFYKELGFPLGEIRKLVGSPEYDREEVLRSQSPR
jgi:DNA-binding transcriptional MerR regulator